MLLAAYLTYVNKAIQYDVDLFSVKLLCSNFKSNYYFYL